LCALSEAVCVKKKADPSVRFGPQVPRVIDADIQALCAQYPKKQSEMITGALEEEREKERRGKR